MDTSSNDENLDRLINLYQDAEEDQFALFLGSGVNGGPWAAEHPACASWPRLLEETGCQFLSKNQVQAILEAGDTDWIKAAARLFEGLDRETVIKTIDSILYAGIFRDPKSRSLRSRKHKILAWKVLQKMDTLRSAICFSAAINCPEKGHSMRRNPKVGRILTTNYDFFFSAAWPRYTSMRKSWWPVTWASKGTRLAGAGAIVYLHGYLPYSGEMERDVIITETDYNRAYMESGAGSTGFTWHELTEAIDGYHLLFIGFSFSDARVREAITRRRRSREHFAFIHVSDASAFKAAGEAGVIPITVNSWTEIPEKLRSIYCAGLTKQELDAAGKTELTYWAALEKGLEPRS